jgi:peptidoglycan/LPS O-acetylase OafA/YrhL
MYHIWRGLYGAKETKGLTAAVYALAALRFALCAFPQNGWLTNESGALWGVLRNLPFAALGALIVVLYFRRRGELKRFRFVWLYVTLSFVFYLPVAVAAGLLPILGMLMLPKTVCYMFLIATFYLAVAKDEPIE